MKRIVGHLAAAVAVLASLAAPAYAADETPAGEVAAQAAAPAALQTWKAMAAQEANVLASQLSDKSGPWAVRVAAGSDSIFSGVFVKMLISELAARGVQLSVGAERPASVIELQADRSPDAVLDEPGALHSLKWLAQINATQQLALTLVASTQGTVVASNTNLYQIKAADGDVYAAALGRRLDFTR